MFFKSRYIHFQPDISSARYNGFSVRLSPSYDPSLVDFQFTICSKKDMFSKKKARDQLANSPTLSIPVSSLPPTLAALELRVYGWRQWDEYTSPKDRMSNKWAWVWKYFV